MDDAMVYLFSHTRPKLNHDGTINMNAYYLKGVRGFDHKFPYDCVVILKDLLSNEVIIIYVLLIAFQESVVQ